MKHSVQDRALRWLALLSVLASAACIAGAGIPADLLASPASAHPAATGWSGLTSGWATFGLVLPAGVATSGVQIGTLTTQTDVKVRWPDGTIRFAVVTAKVQAAGVYTIRAATTPPGSFVPANPAATVALTNENGWSGAQGAYDYLWPFIGAANSHCPNGGPDIPYLGCRAGWTLDFDTK